MDNWQLRNELIAILISYYPGFISKKHIKKIMERLADKTVDELKKIREDYVKKYIGDFDKPCGYKSELKTLDRLIAAKG